MVYFSNGDIKQIFPNRPKQVYYFNEAKTVQTIYPDNLQIFKLENGKIEKLFNDETKQVEFPDGSLQYTFPNGNEEIYFPNGNIQKINSNGVISLEYENDIKEVKYPKGKEFIIYPDDTQKQINK